MPQSLTREQADRYGAAAAQREALLESRWAAHGPQPWVGSRGL
jgi:hypothetical protein